MSITYREAKRILEKQEEARDVIKVTGEWRLWVKDSTTKQQRINS